MTENNIALLLCGIPVGAGFSTMGGDLLAKGFESHNYMQITMGAALTTFGMATFIGGIYLPYKKLQEIRKSKK